MAIIVDTVDPGVEGAREAVEEYVKKYPELEGALKLYGAVMELQQAVMEEVECPVERGAEEVEARLRSLVPIIDATELTVDGTLYRRLVGDICGVMERMRPDGFPHAGELSSWEGLSDENLPHTTELVLQGKELPVTGSWDGEPERTLATNILWEALAPFYRKCGTILAFRMDQALWQRGYCPVCGSAPLMGLFREEDGLWLVECSLCHTMWNVQRASCPFCPESLGALEYLYIGDDSTRRVQYCSSCRVYLKTVDLRGSGREVLLPLEDIVTCDLDLAARQEELNPASGRRVEE